MDSFWAWVVTWLSVMVALAVGAVLIPSIRFYCIVGLMLELIAYCVSLGVLYYFDQRKWRRFMNEQKTGRQANVMG